MKYVKLTFLALAFFFLGSQNISAQKSSYIEKHTPIAKNLSEKYGIPEQIILAVAYMESGGGNSKLAKLANNHFGIVGKNTVYKSRYRSFESTEESFESFCKLLTRKNFYTKLKGSKNINEWVSSIAATGYSTNPSEWKSKVMHTLRKFW